jgi:hypothetical protein
MTVRLVLFASLGPVEIIAYSGINVSPPNNKAIMKKPISLEKIFFQNFLGLNGNCCCKALIGFMVDNFY